MKKDINFFLSELISFANVYKSKIPAYFHLSPLQGRFTNWYLYLDKTG